MLNDTVSKVLQSKPGPKIVTVAPDASVTYAVCLMNHHGIGAVLVMQDGQLTGIFSERDVLRRVIEPGLDPSITRVGEVQTARPRTIAVNERAARALDLMVEGRFRHLPVTDGDRVTGALSLSDLTRWLLGNLAAHDEGAPAAA
jgi:CBS domain-containing protein